MLDPVAFANDTSLTVHYLPGTTGWGAFFAGFPSVLRNLVGPDRRFNRWFGNQWFWIQLHLDKRLVVVVEACTNLANPTWYPVQTNTITAGALYFKDPQWTNFPARYYRLHWQ